MRGFNEQYHSVPYSQSRNSYEYPRTNKYEIGGKLSQWQEKPFRQNHSDLKIEEENKFLREKLQLQMNKNKQLKMKEKLLREENYYLKQQKGIHYSSQESQSFRENQLLQEKLAQIKCNGPEIPPNIQRELDKLQQQKIQLMKENQKLIQKQKY